MESGDEDDAFTMGEREWQKMNRDLSKQGFRDGKNEGRESGLQKSFEKSTSMGLKYSIQLGQIIGVIEWKLTQTLEETKREKLESCREQVINMLDDLKNSTELSSDDEVTLQEKISSAAEKLVQELLFLCGGETSSIRKMLEGN